MAISSAASSTPPLTLEQQPSSVECVQHTDTPNAIKEGVRKRIVDELYSTEVSYHDGLVIILKVHTH